MTLAPHLIHRPQSHFGIAACQRCFARPCIELRVGNRAGEMILVLQESHGGTECPFFVEDIRAIDQFLRSLEFHDLNGIYEWVLSDLAGTGIQARTHEPFVNSFEDMHGRVEYLLDLIARNILISVELPIDWRTNPKIREWFNIDYPKPAAIGEIQTAEPEPEPEAAAGAATQSTMGLSYPRWQHKDEKKRRNTPDFAYVGDTVLLCADSRGIAGGSTVTAAIYDPADQSGKSFTSGQGTITSDAAEVEWIVSVPENAARAESIVLEFEVKYKGHKTAKCDIEVRRKMFYLSV